jgi:hypothetical protein
LSAFVSPAAACEASVWSCAISAVVFALVVEVGVVVPVVVGVVPVVGVVVVVVGVVLPVDERFVVVCAGAADDQSKAAAPSTASRLRQDVERIVWLRSGWRPVVRDRLPRPDITRPDVNSK